MIPWRRAWQPTPVFLLENPWTEEPGRLVHGVTELDTNEATLHTYTVQTANSLAKTLMLGKIEGRRRGKQKMRWLDSTTDSMGMNSGKLWEMMRNREA